MLVVMTRCRVDVTAKEDGVRLINFVSMPNCLPFCDNCHVK